MAPSFRLKLELSIDERSGLREKLRMMSVSSKTPEGIRKTAVPIGLDEIEYLKVAFTRALEIILNW